MIKLKTLIINLVISLGIGGLASFLTRNSMDIYKDILLPSFAPPSWLFPIAWTILYTLMGISSYMIYESKSKLRGLALTVYTIQLIVNFIWPLLFFNGRMFFVAFICLIILWLIVIWMVNLFNKVKSLAAYIQIPYIVWLTFAAYLNWNIYILNR